MMFWARLSQSRVKEISIDVTLNIHQFLARLRVFRTQIEHCLQAGPVDAQITVDAIGGIEQALVDLFRRFQLLSPAILSARSCIENRTLAIAPQSQRDVCRSLWLAQSLLVQSNRMSPFRRPVSAAKNSVPGSRFGDWFDDRVGSRQFGPDSLHHPVCTIFQISRDR